MASNDDEEGGNDVMFVTLVIAGAYFLYQLWRDHVAAGYGGGVFQPAAPSSDPTEGILNILVPLQLSPTGAAFIKAQEGFQASAYADGKGQSIGYGHQIQPGENIVSPITPAEADALFASDAAAAARTVSNALQVQTTQNQFDALTDLAYNIGSAAFLNSTLLQLLNQGDYAGAAQQFSGWVHSAGQVNQGLQARRAADLNLFNGG